MASGHILALNALTENAVARLLAPGQWILTADQTRPNAPWCSELGQSSARKKHKIKTNKNKSDWDFEGSEMLKYPF